MKIKKTSLDKFLSANSFRLTALQLHQILKFKSLFDSISISWYNLLDYDDYTESGIKEYIFQSGLSNKTTYISIDIYFNGELMLFDKGDLKIEHFYEMDLQCYFNSPVLRKLSMLLSD